MTGMAAQPPLSASLRGSLGNAAMPPAGVQAFEIVRHHLRLRRTSHT